MKVRKGIIVLVFGLVLLSLTFTAMISCTCRPIPSVDNSIVQVWKSDTLEAFGVVVGDGSQVLTVLNYEGYTPDSLEVVLPGQGKYKASVEAIDPRTSATLLKLEGARLPVAAIGDFVTIKPGQQPVLIRGWSGPQLTFKKTPALIAISKGTVPLFFDVHLSQKEVMRGEWVRGQGAVVTDVKDRVLGLVGTFYSSLILSTGGPIGWIPPVVSINSAIGLLAPDVAHQPWANGPAISAIAIKDDVQGYTSGVLPSPANYDKMTTAIQELLGKLGDPLASDDIPQRYYSSLAWPEPGSGDGTLLTVVYPRPVDLRDTDGRLLAHAK